MEIKQASEALFRSLSPEQLTWKPDRNVWSILECFDHMLTTNGLYIPKLETTIEKAEKTGKLNKTPFKPSLFGRFFIRSMGPRSRLKVKTFKAFKPTHGPENLDVITKFLDQQDELLALIERADGCNVNAVKFSSPISPLIRFSIGEGLSVLVVHEQRHLLQAQNVQLCNGFPEFQQAKKA